MTIENPERLWAAKYRDEDGFEYITVFERSEDAEGSHRHGTDAPVQAYVREDVAEAEPRRLAEALAASERYADTCRDAWEDASDERHALREEAAALRRERDALREHLRIVLLAFEEETSQGDGIREEHAPGYEAAKVAAGKGVG